MAKQLLVVDDEKAITSALLVLLNGAGYEVVIAHSGEEALRQLSAGKPDLIISQGKDYE